jgi:paraquat-inducible protein B
LIPNKTRPRISPNPRRRVKAGYGDDSRFRRDVDRLMPQLTDTVRSVRALADLLSRHPEALIRGRTNTGTE